MINNSTSINKTNNHLFNSDGQQFHQYQQNKQSTLNKDDQQLHQYQQNEQSPLISTEQTEHKKMHAIYRGKLMFLLEPGKKRWRGNV